MASDPEQHMETLRDMASRVCLGRCCHSADQMETLRWAFAEIERLRQRAMEAGVEHAQLEAQVERLTGEVDRERERRRRQVERLRAIVDDACECDSGPHGPGCVAGKILREFAEA